MFENISDPSSSPPIRRAAVPDPSSSPPIRRAAVPDYSSSPFIRRAAVPSPSPNTPIRRAVPMGYSLPNGQNPLLRNFPNSEFKPGPPSLKGLPNNPPTPPLERIPSPSVELKEQKWPPEYGELFLKMKYDDDTEAIKDFREIYNFFNDGDDDFGISPLRCKYIRTYYNQNNKKLMLRYDNICPLIKPVFIDKFNDIEYYYNASIINFDRKIKNITYFASHCPIEDTSGGYVINFKGFDTDLFLKMLINNDIKLICIPIKYEMRRSVRWFPNEIGVIKTYEYQDSAVPERECNYKLECTSKEVIYAPKDLKKEETINIYKIKITDNLQTKEHYITIIEYDNWPDMGIPTQKILLYNYIYKIYDTITTLNLDKILVHCSAGVGRTGTVITCIELLKYFFANKDSRDDYPLNKFIIDTIITMRSSRPQMVQKLDQFNTILDFKKFLMNNKIYTIEEFKQYIEDITKPPITGGKFNKYINKYNKYFNYNTNNFSYFYKKYYS